ncbi:unnamed protein product, partial [Phaeothamnion confervicola]
GGGGGSGVAIWGTASDMAGSIIAARNGRSTSVGSASNGSGGGGGSGGGLFSGFTGSFGTDGAGGDGDMEFTFGAFVLTTHRILFIARPEGEAPVIGEDGRHAEPPFLQVALAQIASSRVKRRWKEHLAAIQLECKDGRSLYFAVVQGHTLEEDLADLQAVQRLEQQVAWLAKEDNFASVANLCSVDAAADPDGATLETPSPLALWLVGDGAPLRSFSDPKATWRDGGVKDGGCGFECPRSFYGGDVGCGGGARADGDGGGAGGGIGGWDSGGFPPGMFRGFPSQYCPHAEFERQDCVTPDGPWRYTTANARWEVCSSYPRLLVVPTAVSDELLVDAAAGRSRSRVPALTWVHPTTGAALCRSSQVLRNLQTNLQNTFGLPAASTEDEMVLDDIRRTATWQRADGSLWRPRAGGHAAATGAATWPVDLRDG